jgi:hypothetical protein
MNSNAIPSQLPVPGPGPDVVALPSDPVEWERLSGAGIRTFFRIAELWGLDVDQQMALLGLRSRSTYFKWKRERKAKLDRDQLERISHILGIYKALQILLPDAPSADAWVKRPNKAEPFQGEPALEWMIRGGITGLFTVRRYLDAQRGGWA